MPDMPPRAPLAIRINAEDNVAVVVNDGGLPHGALLNRGLSLREHIPQGHKVALVDLPAGAAVRRYNSIIGYALADIAAGSWVHERLLRTPEVRPLSVATAMLPHATPSPLEGYTFEGYINADGSVGTRNILAVAQTVQCTAGVADYAVERIKRELLPQYPQVDDVVALGHTYGCGVAIEAPGAEIAVRTLRNITLNPNFGGDVMVISLGCEKLQPERLFPRRTIQIVDEREQDAATKRDALGVVRLQNPAYVGFQSMIEAIMVQAKRHLERLNLRQRQTVPASELIVGVQCGGSDSFSGITANPAVGYCTDLLVRAGATVMFSEVSEVRDAIDQMTARASSPDVAAAMIREVAWYDDYLGRGGVDRSANTTPGNKQGGLSNIVEKALGSVVKSGSLAISGVLAPGEKLRQKGLIFAATPASDFICGTLQVAAGMNVHVFTTGRGTPYGLAEVPVIKVATRSELARRWHDLIDLNAGTIANGEKTIEEVGWELFHLIREVASGRQKTWAEHWHLRNDLVLFNPAPVT